MVLFADPSDLEAGRDEHGRVRDHLAEVPAALHQHHGQHRHRGRPALDAPSHKTLWQGCRESRWALCGQRLRQTGGGPTGGTALRDQRMIPWIAAKAPPHFFFFFLFSFSFFFFFVCRISLMLPADSDDQLVHETQCTNEQWSWFCPVGGGGPLPGLLWYHSSIRAGEVGLCEFYSICSAVVAG